MSLSVYSDIILLTKHFPFNRGETPGETFLETEISLLSRHARRVVVFAADVRCGTEKTVNLPDNVIAIPLLKHSAKAAKLFSFIHGFRYLFRAPHEVRDEARKRNLGEKYFLYYFVSRAARKKTKILSWYEQNGGFGDNVLIYSYWFYDFARTAVLVNDELRRAGRKITCISRAHRYDLYDYTNPLHYLPMRPWLLERLDFVFPCSQDGTEYLSSKYGNPRGNIRTSYIGTRDCGIGKWEQKALPHLVSCSRIVPVKRIERILDALVLLEKQNIAVRWTHLGGGEELDKIKSSCQKHLRQSSAVFAGNMTNTGVLDFYRTYITDIFINVSENEGLPASIIEAASFGIPAIATDVGGTSEIVENGANGYLLDRDFTNDELVDAIKRMLTLPELEYLRIRSCARNIWEEKFKFPENSLNMLKEVQAYDESSEGQIIYV